MGAALADVYGGAVTVGLAKKSSETWVLAVLFSVPSMLVPLPSDVLAIPHRMNEFQSFQRVQIPYHTK